MAINTNQPKVNYQIVNGRVVNEGSVEERDVYISDGRIVGSLPQGGIVTIDASGCYVMPGVIDTHVHFREPGLTDKACMLSESRAAAAGGVTSVIDMPNTVPQTTTLELLEAKEALARQHCTINYGFMLGATNDNIDQLLSVTPTRYAAIKLFLGSSTGNMLVNDEKQLDHLFANAAKLIVAHCEDEQVVSANLAHYRSLYEGTEGEQASLHPLIRSSEACYVCTERAVKRARHYGTRFHIAHLTTAAELSLLDDADSAHKSITAEVSPNHLFFTDADYRRLGNFIKCNPAIKSLHDRTALRRALINGLIDTIATDHAPHTLASKQKPYFAAPGGIPSIQHSLPMVVDITSEFFGPSAAERDRQMALVVERMCHAPARIFGISQRGYLREGYWADIAVINPSKSTTVTTESLHYQCGWSPMVGHTFSSSVVHTFINGHLYDADVRCAMPLKFNK